MATEPLGLSYVIPGSDFSSNPNLPYDYPDAVMVPATDFMFDLRYPECLSLTAEPAAGTVINNLVAGKPAAVITGAGVTRSKGGLAMPGAANTFINLGKNYHPGASSFVRILHLEITEAVTGYSQLLGRATNTQPANFSYTMDSGANGLDFRGGVSNGTNSNTALKANAFTLAKKMQVAVAWEDQLVKAFVNGVLVNTSAVLTGPINENAVNDLILMGSQGGFTRPKGIWYRALGENLTASGRTAAAVVALDYAENLAFLNS